MDQRWAEDEQSQSPETTIEQTVSTHDEGTEDFSEIPTTRRRNSGIASQDDAT